MVTDRDAKAILENMFEYEKMQYVYVVKSESKDETFILYDKSFEYERRSDLPTLKRKYYDGRKNPEHNRNIVSQPYMYSLKNARRYIQEYLKGK